jgi:outer membrane lipase/esterase
MGLFLTNFPGRAPSDALYVVDIGGEDLRDALVALVTDPSGVTSQAILVDALSAIQSNISVLASAGAHTLLVANAPDLSLAPELRLAGPEAQAAGQALALAFNSSLETLLAGLESALLIKVFRLDLFELSQEVVAAPAAFGLTNVMDSCITPDTLIGAFCSQPDRYLFWDGNHPTAAAQGIVASRALSVLAGP